MLKKPSSCIVPGLCHSRRACLSQHSNYGSSNWYARDKIRLFPHWRNGCLGALSDYRGSLLWRCQEQRQIGTESAVSEGMQRRHMMHSTASAAHDSPRQSSVAHGCFCNPHRQEPDILSLFQTIAKAASPLCFLETKRSAGPLRVMLGTAHTTMVVPTHHRQICHSAADAHLRRSRIRHPVRKTPYTPLSYTPGIRQGLANR